MIGHEVEQNWKGIWRKRRKHCTKMSLLSVTLCCNCNKIIHFLALSYSLWSHLLTLYRRRLCHSLELVISAPFNRMWFLKRPRLNRFNGNNLALIINKSHQQPAPPPPGGWHCPYRWWWCWWPRPLLLEGIQMNGHLNKGNKFDKKYQRQIMAHHMPDNWLI